MSRRFPLLALAGTLLFAVLPAVASSASAGPLVSRAQALGLTCSPVTSTDGVAYTKCSGELASFDGIGLETDLSLPTAASAALPTVVMLHGWSENKSKWESDSRTGSGETYHWNNVWFASNGWAALNYTARGFMDSCGQFDTDANCATGWTHLADRSFETKDSQYLLGLLVDAGIADPRRLVATGGSYGGGQSWLLATSPPWSSPLGSAQNVQLAAAVPLYPWTDLLYALAPNGRETDSVDQSRPHELPLGVPKESYIAGLYAVGRAEAQGRYNTVDATDQGSALDADIAFVQAGEPYDANPLAPGLIQAFRQKSAYYADGYFAAVKNGSVREVPVLSVQGWTDPLFPVPETVQMYRKLKAADPAYPVAMVFGDIGHSNAQNPAWEWRQINDLANQFVANAIGSKGAAKLGAEAYSFPTQCPAATSAQSPVSGAWDRLARGSVVATVSAGQTTASAEPNAQDGGATDPIVHSGCMSEQSGGETGIVRSWKVPTGGLTLLGLDDVTTSYSLQGVDATLALKLWDVAPDGTKTLVSRGVYRLAEGGGDPAAGTIDVKLYGNMWRFEPGHRIQLQLVQVDGPYLRPDNLPSAITFGAIRLVLPVREALKGVALVGA